jgi:hypothetical protein
VKSNLILLGRVSGRIERVLKEGFGAWKNRRMLSAQTLADKDFLALFNIEGVASALAKDDLLGAREALIAHYRLRVQAGWPKFPALLEEIAKLVERDDGAGGPPQSDAGPGFLNDRTWREFPQFGRATVKRLLAWADKVLENRIILGGVPEVFVGEGVNWRDPPQGDMQWVWTLNRHEWFPLLFQAYTESGDGRYADKVIELILDWLSKNPPPARRDESSAGWRLMEVGMRMYLSWIPAFGLLFNLPSLTDEAKVKILRGICDHARFLSLFRTNRNHLVRESIGLAYVGVYFSEFKESSRWREIAFSRLAQELPKQFNHDGSHIEMATAYQWLVVTEFQYLYDLLESAKQSLPQQDLTAWLEKMYHYLAHVVRPNYTFPQINDGFTDPNYTLLHKLSQAGDKLKRGDFVYVGTEGREGMRPSGTSVAFRDAGVYVMRSGWGKDARYLFFDAGPYGGPHGHEDKLSIEVYGYGQPFIVDPGTYTYDWKDPFRTYFVSSLSHNVVTVDGKSQVRRWDRRSMTPAPAEGNYATWISCPEYDYAAASYENGYGDYSANPSEDAIIDRVIHRRQILFIKPDYWLMVDELEGDRPHHYTLLFQAPPGIAAKVRREKRVVLSSPENGACLEIIPMNPEHLEVKCVSGSEAPIRGWYAGSGYHSKWPSPTVALAHQQNRAARLITLLYPSLAWREGEPIAMSPIELHGGEGIAVVIESPLGSDYVMLSPTEGIKRFGAYESSENVAVIRNKHR